jgi:hypothetical protein
VSKIKPIKIRVKVAGVPVRITIGADHLIEALSQLAKQLPQKQRVKVLEIIEWLLEE